MKLLVFFAFPQEVGEIVRIMGPARRIEGLPFKVSFLRHASHELTMVETGLGVKNAGRAFTAMVQEELPDAVLCPGYCGALSPDASIGDVIWASKACLAEGQHLESLSLPGSLELFRKLALRLPVRNGTFITMKEWIRKRDLVNLVSPEMTLPVCDMETFALAHLCRGYKLPFYSIRAVTDGAHRDLPFDPWSVCDDKGIYSVARALRLFAARPHLLLPGIELFRNSRIASRNLSRALAALFDVL